MRLAVTFVHRLHKVVLGVKPYLVGTRLGQATPLLLAAGAGDDVGAGKLGKLPAAHADTAAGAEDQHLLAGLDLADGVHHADGGAIGDRQRRRLLETNRVGNPPQLTRLGAADFGGTAVLRLSHHATSARIARTHSN